MIKRYVSVRGEVPYRRDIYEPLNRTSSRIVRVAAASGLAQEFQIVRPLVVQQKSKLRIVRARSIRVYMVFRKVLSLETFVS